MDALKIDMKATLAVSLLATIATSCATTRQEHLSEDRDCAAVETIPLPHAASSDDCPPFSKCDPLPTLALFQFTACTEMGAAVSLRRIEHSIDGIRIWSKESTRERPLPTAYTVYAGPLQPRRHEVCSHMVYQTRSLLWPRILEARSCFTFDPLSDVFNQVKLHVVPETAARGPAVPKITHDFRRIPFLTK